LCSSYCFGEEPATGERLRKARRSVAHKSPLQNRDIVEESVQRGKIIRIDRRIHLHRQLGDGLTDVAIAVHEFRHGSITLAQIREVVKNNGFTAKDTVMLLTPDPKQPDA
jgi:hypothetical protein